MAGFNFSYDNDTIQIGGSVRWNHRDGDVMSRRAVENFISRSGAFENSVNQNFSRSDSWNAQLRLEWKPDTMTNIMFRPSMSISSNDGLTSSSSANFNEDPFRYFADPLAVASIAKMAEDSIIVNSSLDKEGRRERRTSDVVFPSSAACRQAPAKYRWWYRAEPSLYGLVA